MLPRKTQAKENRIAKSLISFVVFMLLVVVMVKSVELRQKRNEWIATPPYLEQQIQYEENRAAEISEYETYTKTKAYVEEIARDKLGLVYEGEILFKDENKSK